MDRLWDDVQQPLDPALEHATGSRPTGRLHNEGHGEALPNGHLESEIIIGGSCLVEYSQLAMLRLRICRVEVDTAIEDRSMHVLST